MARDHPGGRPRMDGYREDIPQIAEALRGVPPEQLEAVTGTLNRIRQNLIDPAPDAAAQSQVPEEAARG